MHPRGAFHHLKTRLNGRMSSDEGFGLIEAVVALVIIFGLVLTLMTTLDASSRVIVSTRQQSSANALAIELIERSQALEWQNMGLASSVNGAACPAEVGCFIPDFPGRLVSETAGYTFDGEPMVFATGDTFRPFLDFHAVLDRDGTDFRRYIFITGVDDDSDGSEDFRRLTAVVRWETSPGFPNEVVQTTLVSPFVEPDQPLMRSDIGWEAGTLGLDARTVPLVYDPDTTVTGDEITLAAGAAGAFSNGEFYNLSIVLPRMNSISVADYISRAIGRTESTSIAAGRFAANDTVLNTLDDAFVALSPSAVSELADDDSLNAAPLTNGPSIGTLSGTRFISPTGVTIAEVDSGNVLAPGPQAYLSAGWLLDVVHDDIPTIPEQLPYATTAFLTTDRLFVGGGHADQAFTFYQRNGRVSAQGIGDRDNDTVLGTRDTYASGAVVSGAIQLFHDTVLAKTFADFDGWAVVEGRPVGRLNDWAFSVQAVGAGQSPFAAATSAGGLRLKIWDVATSSYAAVGILDLTSLGSCGAPIFSSPTAVQQVEVPSPADMKTVYGYDTLRYTVQVELDLRSFCETKSLNTLGDVAEHTWQTSGPVVSGTVNYVVEGKSSTGTYAAFIDLQATIALDQLIVTSVYIDPDAS
jgi:hypothetical protein